jgi:hypothetical protein
MLRLIGALLMANVVTAIDLKAQPLREPERLGFASASNSRTLSAGSTLRTLARPMGDGPLVIRTVLFAVGGAVTGATAGLLIDWLACRSNEKAHPTPGEPLFGSECFLPAERMTGFGWYAGATLGASLGASRFAERRGCTSRARRVATVTTAAIGLAPGLAYLASGRSGYKPRGVQLAFATPVLGGALATIPVLRCRR